MSVNRLTGLTTGMDTDQLVKDLMKIEQARYDKVDIKKQYAKWEQEAYRTTIATIDEFQEKYFDVLKQENYLMSASSFTAFTSSTLVNGEEEKYVTVTGTADAVSLTHTIESVDNLATTDKWNSSVTGIASVNSVALTLEKLNTIKDEGGTLDLSIDGKTKTISFTGTEFDEIDGLAGDELTVDDLISVLNDKIEAAFGSGYSDVVSKITNGSNEYIKFDQPGATVGVYSSSGSPLLSRLGISSGITNESYETRSINTLFGITDNDLDDFSINGVKITTLTSSDTVEEFTEKINAANTGAKLSFNAKSNRFLLESDKTGTVNNLARIIG
jgi:flagellar hook-associated protein 2